MVLAAAGLGAVGAGYLYYFDEERWKAVSTTVEGRVGPVLETLGRFRTRVGGVFSGSSTGYAMPDWMKDKVRAVLPKKREAPAAAPTPDDLVRRQDADYVD